MTSIIDRAISKLQGELQDIKQPYMEKPIVEYLEANLDDPLAEHIVLEHKSLKKCIEYIRAEARKKLNGSNGFLPDQEVYDMSIAYFQIDDAVEERQKAEAAAKRSEDAQERQRKASAAREAKQAVNQSSRNPKPNQLSLFDGLEGANA